MARVAARGLEKEKSTMKVADLRAIVQDNLDLTVFAENEGCTEIECAGDVGFATVQPENEPLLQLLGPDVYSRRVLLNFEKVGQLYTSGISWLIICRKRFAQNGGVLVLHSISPLVNQVIKLLNLERVLHIRPDLPSARAFALQA
jgi:anti-anti-sigma factor